MTSNNVKYFAAIASNPKIGSKTILKLDKLYGGLENLFDQNKQIKLHNLALPNKIITEIDKTIKSVSPQKIMDNLSQKNIIPICIHDELYPNLLLEIPDPPAILYVRGSTKILKNLAIAIVGSRKYSTYGKRVTQQFTSQLSLDGLTIISGLALGIDSLAHETTLAQGGLTIGVLACGLDMIYPYSNIGLADRIIKSGGAIISEYPPGVLAYKSNFPLRNRIIAGMSLGTLVVEAMEKSGTLLTAKATLDYNRELFAVPGDIYRPSSEGVNNLIKYGATLVTNHLDIEKNLNLDVKKQASKAKKIIPDNLFEKKILESLSQENAVHVDKILKNTQIEISILNATLVMMEMKGKIKNLGNNQYILN